ncbi:MAG: DUF29 domain-containing protein [Alphaproteobacteria bacterium]|nr:DUF29 domain-containing protein [Alphaproteobacteria bacterium]MBV9860789.1 DUF29 domain-containing protein [Alphaproteobacteria bacterium]
MTSETEMRQLYDRDFVQWTENQATALRRAQSTYGSSAGANLPLDWENLAEEIESLGTSDRRALHSHIRRIVRHLLKLAASPAPAPRRGWALTTCEARADIAAVLRDSLSLRHEIDGIIAEEAGLAAELAAADLEQHGELTSPVQDQLHRTTFTADQVLDYWFPDSPELEL